MACNDLTDDQRELIKTLIEELASGSYKKQFSAIRRGTLWSFYLRDPDEVLTELPGAHEPTDFQALEDLKYLTTVQVTPFETDCSLSQKALGEYELLKHPRGQPSALRPDLRMTSADFPELAPSIQRFRSDHPDPQQCAFLMMKFQETPLHNRIIKAVRDTCSQHEIQALRADDKRYADDLLANVRTYMHGCSSGIAVLERLTEDEFNPNVSLEVGYMMAQGKPVCLLKDETLSFLHTDLLGRLYDPFDTQDPENTIPPVLQKWFRDKGIVE